jgi:Spy/CpxP family protein refolding chaperone
MKLISKTLMLVPAALLVAGLGLATTADAAMMKKMSKKEMKMAEMHCKEMHGMMMHGKCEMKKMKKK